MTIPKKSIVQGQGKQPLRQLKISLHAKSIFTCKKGVTAPIITRYALEKSDESLAPSWATSSSPGVTVSGKCWK